MNKPNQRELPSPLPPNNTEAIEILRVWADNKGYLTLKQDYWDDPAMWGILLVDIARHVANATTNSERPTSVILDRIKKGFDLEWEARSRASLK